MLSFELTTTIDALMTNDAIDDFDAMLQHDNSVWEDENATSDTKSVAAKPPTLNRSGDEKSSTKPSSLKGKDARSIPFSKRMLLQASNRPSEVSAGQSG
ncbi:unnamed protein product [Peronospora farinosa]|uniref:Uncharacterized protein n=1 Tax=Peronospora farinosa TaxID=134698 RepID=A0ABN8BRM4_9STRA|nr:unnamed protein product [Peronospora farinosa]